MTRIKETFLIHRFKEKGEKTGWTYIEFPAAVANKLKKGNRKSFRVKGTLDAVPVNALALIPMGEGNFILPLKADLRKKLNKKLGDSLQVNLVEDKDEIIFDQNLMMCLEDLPEALEYFNSLTVSHRHYFSNWVKSAKTDATVSKRIARIVNAMLKKQNYSEMLHDKP